TLLTSLLSAVLFGLAPALASSGAAPGESLKAGGRGGESRGRGRARAALVVTQAALSVVLLIGAGLLIRSFQLLGGVDPGFQAPRNRVLTMLVSPTGPQYRDPKALAAYWDRLIDRLRAVPGVDAASIGITIPPNRVAFTDGFDIQGKPAAAMDYPAV